MSPFEEGSLPPEAYDVDFVMKRFNVTREFAEQRKEKIVVNDTYQVNGRTIKQGKGFPACDILWLSIKHRDKEAIHDWRDLQTIKNILAGPEREAVEIYPAESRLVDTGRVFMDTRVRMPFGFMTRLVGSPDEATAVGAKQRPFNWTEK